MVLGTVSTIAALYLGKYVEKLDIVNIGLSLTLIHLLQNSVELSAIKNVVLMTIPILIPTD